MPLSFAIALHQVVDIQRRFAEELLAAFGFQRDQAALDGADAGGGDVAVLGGEVFGIVAHMLQHGPQILEVKQQQAIVVGNLEHQRQHAGLGVVEIEHAGQQQRPHFGDGGAHRMALFAEYIPERDRAAGKGKVGKPQFGDALDDLGFLRAGLADARKVALDVGHEHRHADAAEIFRHHLQRNGFAGAGGAGDEAVAVGQLRQQKQFLSIVLGDQGWGDHGRAPDFSECLKWYHCTF